MNKNVPWKHGVENEDQQRAHYWPILAPTLQHQKYRQQPSQWGQMASTSAISGLDRFQQSESLGARHDSHEATSENCGLVSHLG